MLSDQADGLFLNDSFFNLATSVLCCYDHIITLDDEVRCVWGRRISGGSLLFILNRYATLVLSLALIVKAFTRTAVSDGHQNATNTAAVYDKICSDSVHLVDICLILMNIAYVAFAALRIFALYDLKKRVFVLVFFIGIVHTCMRALVMYIESSGPSQNNRTTQASPSRASKCHNHGHHQASDPHFLTKSLLFSMLRIHSLIFEAILITLTWKKTVTRWNLQKSIVRTPLTTMLLRDGTLYFAMIASISGLNILGMILYSFTHEPTISKDIGRAILSLTGPLVDALTSICMSRFILGLRVVALDGGNPQLELLQHSTVRFAYLSEAITGNLGGDLPEHVDDEEDATDSEDARTENLEVEPAV